MGCTWLHNNWGISHMFDEFWWCLYEHTREQTRKHPRTLCRAVSCKIASFTCTPCADLADALSILVRAWYIHPAILWKRYDLKRENNCFYFLILKYVVWMMSSDSADSSGLLQEVFAASSVAGHGSQRSWKIWAFWIAADCTWRAASCLGTWNASSCCLGRVPSNP